MNTRKFTVLFEEDGVELQLDEGTSLLQAQILAGKMPDAVCGGKGSCGKCKVVANGREVLACQTKLYADTVLSDPEFYDKRSSKASVERDKEKAQILMTKIQNKTVFEAEAQFLQMAQPVLAAVDIGTTTVVAYLMDARNGKLLGMNSSLNPQRKYGADVVSRCSYALEQGPEYLSQAIRTCVNALLEDLLASHNRTKEDLMRVVLVGNTGMHHLFLEYPTRQLVLAPYHPYRKEACILPAADCQLDANPDAEIWWLPNIGGFVGADTVGCILATDIPHLEKITLMVDIGTNGEMVLGNKDGLMACSTAAGPAFEGAKITCGMRGSEGAIDKVWVENGQVRYHVLGDVEAKGICGSGLLDAAAALLEAGILEASGHLDETYYFTDQVFLNQKDIRELQLAKAAIAAGIQILCMRKGIEINDIEQILLAGAFGNYLNPDSACAIGLLPPELKDRIHQVGNAAGEGAQLAALSPTMFESAKAYAANTQFMELALDPDFQDVYVDELMFGPEDED